MEFRLKASSYEGPDDVGLVIQVIFFIVRVLNWKDSQGKCRNDDSKAKQPPFDFSDDSSFLL